MRRMAFAAATVLLLVPLVAGSGPPTHARESAIHSRRVTASADGGVCRQAGDVTRCRQFVATEYSEPSGRYHETVVRLNQWRNWSNGYGYRDLECVVDVRLLAGGTVANVSIGRCNGDDAVRRAVEAAVYKASPLPEPDNPRVFQRDLRFIFKPEQ